MKRVRATFDTGPFECAGKKETNIGAKRAH